MKKKTFFKFFNISLVSLLFLTFRFSRVTHYVLSVYQLLYCRLSVRLSVTTQYRFNFRCRSLHGNEDDGNIAVTAGKPRK